MNNAISESRWRILSPHLDQALDLSPDQRVAWLKSLRDGDPDLAAELQGLLDDHRALAREDFLANAPGPTSAPGFLGGQMVGCYRLKSPIGQGGMGAVWLAERNDGRFQGLAAVKLLNAALVGREGEQRFAREGTILARLTHPNIARLIDAGVTTAGQPYLVLEYVDGLEIDRYCEQHALDIDGRIALFLQVLAAVTHAHANLIVHRDLKPSNVLVGGDGQVKLLDFGIARLLEDDGGPLGSMRLTREGPGPLTLAYAAPEQIAGGSVSTPSDIHSLGVLLYQLLTGRHPFTEPGCSAASVTRAILEQEPARMSQLVLPGPLRRELRGDLDTIVAKALKKDPAERYVSATSFAEDLRRYARHEPISARPDTVAYRGMKFVRRNWLAVAAVSLTMAGLSVGLVVANHQRRVAQRHFSEVRQLAGKLFDIDVQVKRLPGSSKVRQLIVDTSLDYLQRLASATAGDPDLALEVGTAYLRVARVQGVALSANLGQIDKAGQTLLNAQRFIDSVLASQPFNRTGILRAGQIAHDQMLLAGQRGDKDGAFKRGEQARALVERYLDSGPVEPSEAEQVAIAYMNVGQRYMLEGRLDTGMRIARRTIDIARATGQPLQAGSAHIVLVQSLRAEGDLTAALHNAREAVQALRPPAHDPSVGQVRGYALALTRQAQVLGGVSGPSLGRTEEAITLLERAFKLADDLAGQDLTDSAIRSMVSTAGKELGQLLRHADPQRATEVYDVVLRRLREDGNKARARRDEITVLSDSALPLRKLGRVAEARKRLDTAFVQLDRLGLYPGKNAELGSLADTALSARAEEEAHRGEVASAIATYQGLLDGALQAGTRPEKSLDDAIEFSRVHQAQARLHRLAGHETEAQALDARRLAIWEHWDRALPHNPFIRRQLVAAGPAAPATLR